MKKPEIIESLAAAAGISKVAAEKAVDAYAKCVSDTLRAGGEFAIAGVGKLSVRETKARTGRNPRTGEAVPVPAGKKVAFSASSVIKGLI